MIVSVIISIFAVMAFSWKNHNDIFKGEGIYHLTFVVVNRARILGTLRSLSAGCSSPYIACVDPSELGKAVYVKLEQMRQQYPQLEVIAKQVMPDHFHAVVWMHEGFKGSIKMVARSFSQACSRVARGLARGEGLTAQYDCASRNDGNAGDGNVGSGNAGDGNVGSGNAGGSFGCVDNGDGPTSCESFDCGNGANTLFEVPYIRTLVRKGQLKAMIGYVHNNPDNAWLRKQHPDLYVIRRRVAFSNLFFDTMGKSRLTEWPDAQVIALSRSLTRAQIDEEVRRALYRAELGAVTYTAAINDAERAVAKAVRENGFPLVVMMLDGFPDEGSEAARYFHPNGVYHKICGEGRLLLMVPCVENYSHPEVIRLTEEELQRKALEKGRAYTPIPHSSTRWRMIAGNVMLRIVAGEGR